MAHDLAAHVVAQHFGLDAREFAADADGLALLALLCNAAAKDDPAFYALKLGLIVDAVHAADRRSWWLDAHEWGERGKVVVFIQSRHVLLPSGATAQFAFHLTSADAAVFVALFPDAPAPAGRGWAGVALQPMALNLAVSWLAALDK